MSSITQQPSAKVHHHDHPLKHHHDLHCQTDPYCRASDPHIHPSSTPEEKTTSPMENKPTRATFQVTPELQKRTDDTIKEILQRLERQRNESVPSESPMNEADQQQKQEQQMLGMHNSRRLTPDFLKEARSIHQHHGDANLRHG